MPPPRLPIYRLFPFRKGPLRSYRVLSHDIADTSVFKKVIFAPARQETRALSAARNVLKGNLLIVHSMRVCCDAKGV
jgi:hypothetical protein